MEGITMKPENLKNLRQQKGLTQNELARVAGITENAYQNYEHRKRIPNAVTANRIARALGTTSEMLWGFQLVASK